MARSKALSSALGFFERLGVRLKFRKAKLLQVEEGRARNLPIRGNAGEIRRHGPGAGPWWPGRRLSQEEAWKRAAAKRDELYQKYKDARRRIDALNEKQRAEGLTREENAELRRLREKYGKRRKVVTGAADPETGLSGAGFNGDSYPNDVEWKCAERGALADINRQREAMGLPPTTADRLDYSQAIRLETGQQMPVDGRCQYRIPPYRFPDGTAFCLDTPKGTDQEGWEHTRGVVR